MKHTHIHGTVFVLVCISVFLLVISLQIDKPAADSSVPNDTNNEGVPLVADDRDNEEDIEDGVILEFHAPRTKAEHAVAAEYAESVADDIASRQKEGLPIDGRGVEVETVDLNDDGVSEIVSYGPLMMCGSGGCSVEIYTSTGDILTSVFSTHAYLVWVLEHKTNGFHDLKLSLHGSINGKAGHQTQLGIVRWNGARYELDRGTLRDAP